jgi:uncharacterized repeat protein (TIGR01451 family)
MTLVGRHIFIRCVAPLFLLAGLYGQNCSTTSGVTTCSTTTGASTPDEGLTAACVETGTPLAATSYGVPITVSGAGTSVSKVTLTVNSLSADQFDDNIMLLLVSPSSTLMTLVDGYGNGSTQAAANVTFSDTGTALCDIGSNGSCSPQQFSNGSFQPVALADFDQRTMYPFPSFTLPDSATFNGTPGLSQFPFYAGTGSDTTGASGTLASVFNGGAPNGIWKLYLANLCDAGGTNGAGKVAFTGWSISITSTTAPATTTTLTSTDTTDTRLGSNASFVGDSVTFNASVTSTSTVNTGTVTFSIDGTNETPANVNSSGVATFTIATLTEGAHSVIATYNGNSSFSQSTSTALTQSVNDHTTASNVTATGGTFCNTGTITIPAELDTNAVSAPYPSHVYVGTSNDPNSMNLVGTLTSTTINLKNLTMSGYAAGLEMLLVSPGGQAYEFLSNAGLVTTTGVSGLNINLADSASGYISSSSNLSTGTFNPTVVGKSGLNDAADVFIAPAPQTGLYYAGPGPLVGTTQGNTTLGEAFNGGNATGAWTLYVNNSITGSGTLSGGWCIDLTVLANAAATATTLTSSATGNDQFTDQSVTFTATVTSSGSPVTAGTVTFTDTYYNTATSQTTITTLQSGGALNGNGQATYVAPAGQFTQGTHTITATYSGASGTPNYGTSFKTLSEQVDNHTVVSGNRYCNPGTLTIQGLTTTPYPMHVFVGGLDPDSTPLAGTVKTVSVSLNGFTVSLNSMPDLKSLLTGPSESAGGGPDGTVFDALDFFSHTLTEPSTAITGTGVNLTFADGNSQVGTSGTTLSSGTYAPSSYSQTNTYASPAPTGPYQYAATEGAATSAGNQTFTSAFTGNSQMPNGTWSFYFGGGEPADTATISGTSGGNNSVCVTLTTNPPALAITKTHSGSFTQGGTATYTITVTNNGPGMTAGLVTVTEIPPTGMTLTGLAGNNWTCTVATKTCTRSDQLGSTDSYDTITATLTVSNTAATGTNALTNQASVTGGGASNSPTASDPTTIAAAPSLSVAKTHTGTFTQGQTGTWDITVSNATGAGTTSGTTTVSDTLPTGYTVTSFGGSWSCLGTGTQSATCTSTSAVVGGSSFPGLQITANIPTNSPVSVVNTASAYGGGDPVHSTSGTAASGSDSGLTVVQVASSIAATAGALQSANINGVFATALQATVKDANNVGVPGVTVTFTAPASGASGKFTGTGTNTATVLTNVSGIAMAPAFTANATAGAYSVTASAPGVSPNASFSLTNTSAPAVVTNLTSTTANGSYTVGTAITITVTFSKAVNVTGTPQLALNSGGTAGYTSGSGTSTLAFLYTVAAGQNSARLDATSTGALSLNGGTIQDASTTAATLTLPTPGAAGSIGANTNIVIDTTAPTVVSYNVQWGAETYNVIGTSRNRLPWQITGIQVVFSKAIASANASSLGGVTTTGMSGLGTTTLTWTISPLALGNFPTTLAGAGANALKDAAGNTLSTGVGFSQNLKVLYGDFNDDGVVNSQDLTLLNAARSQSYNILADMNGDGVVNATDVQIVRTLLGSSLP